MLQTSPKQISPQLFDAANEYLARGWSVIPLLGKLPALDSWKEFQARVPTPGEMASWLNSHQKPPTGLAIVTGRVSDLVVVDCDTVTDAHYWKATFTKSPLAVATGRGGIHFYYRMPREFEVRNRAGIFRRHIDIRGEGGYIVAPPSVHPNGRCYVWQESLLGVELPTFDPAWIEAKPSMTPLPRLPDSENIRNVVAYIGRIRATSGEGGHNATFRAACKLRDVGVSATEAFSVLAHWNKTNACPPWSVPELRHKIESAYAREIK